MSSDFTGRWIFDGKQLMVLRGLSGWMDGILEILHHEKQI